MRDITAEIARYLCENGFAAFADALPDRPDEAAAVLEFSANAVGGFFHRSVQIRVRAKSRAKALSLARAAFALLCGGHGDTPILLDCGPAILSPVRSPAMIERDPRERPVFAWEVVVG